jgi:hypothetical protein
LLVVGGRHYTFDGPLPATRETQSHLNNPSLANFVVESARSEAVPTD